MQNIPRSKIRSMAIGPVKITGKAIPLVKTYSPISKTLCAYYTYSVTEIRTVRKRITWETLIEGSSKSIPFLLEDETGVVVVDPSTAEIELTRHRHVHTSDKMENLTPEVVNFLNENKIKISKALVVSESYIVPHQDLYVMGYADLWRGDKPGSATFLKAVMWHNELKRLKTNKAELMQYDADKNGTIDPKEWEFVKKKVLKEVEAKSADNLPEIMMLRKPSEGEMFYISDNSEKDAMDSFNFVSLLGIFGGAALSLGCLWYVVSELGIM